MGKGPDLTIERRTGNTVDGHMTTWAGRPVFLLLLNWKVAVHATQNSHNIMSQTCPGFRNHRCPPGPGDRPDFPSEPLTVGHDFPPCLGPSRLDIDTQPTLCPFIHPVFIQHLLY